MIKRANLAAVVLLILRAFERDAFNIIRSRLELLDPRPQLDFPSPRAPRLPQEIQKGLGDRIRIEQAVRLVGGDRPGLAADAAVYYDVADMNALRRQFAGHALRQST